MKVLLINPPWVRRKDNIWHDVASVMPPLGLAWIAAVLQREGHTAAILDAHAERIPFEQIVERVSQKGQFDIIGITSTTSLIGNALEIARIVRGAFPNIKIVMGGVHPTVLPEEVLGEKAVDIVVRGEGEMTMLDIVNGKPPSDIAGISYRDGEKFIHNPDRELIKDLNSLPMPAYHLLPMDRYHPALGAYKRLPGISMLATRGCPGRCTFCYRLFGSRLRVRSGRRLAEEAKHLQDTYGIKEISFYDDTFTALKKEILEFCKALKELKVDLTWSCFSRTDAVNEEVLRAMKDTGCHQIMYGVEAYSPTILNNIHKRVDHEGIIRAIKLTKKVGIHVRAAFMLGNPGETQETMEETLQFAMKLNPELVIFNITTPFPGTEMFQWADENGYLLTKEWEDYDLAHTVMALPTLPPDAIKEFYSKAYKRFFLRPKYILMKLASMRSWSDWSQAFGGLRTILGI